MRFFTVISTVMLLILSAACTSTGDDITSPTVSNLLNEEKEQGSFLYICHANMRAIASECMIYYVNNSTFPADLEALGEPFSEMTCPECGLLYELKGDEEHFALNCPLPQLPNHGSIVDGVASWPPDPEQWEKACRANMRTIASQALMFFANNNCEFPNNLEEIGMADVTCPACGNTYHYVGGGTEFHVSCPIPSDPNHGFIHTCLASWHEED